jgi:hypothetical protein
MTNGPGSGKLMSRRDMVANMRKEEIAKRHLHLIHVGSRLQTYLLDGNDGNDIAFALRLKNCL